ncbi:Vitamin B12 transporter BtuB precursor (plasmid) [Pseudoalteromonas sp. THAF3]|uniref:TonB-dependent receptor n=1 Tax=Pseudoalteromonas sp. THAF3 TaxID=2587843 RepID=UPI001267CA9D|nr:TonB-dependent receptor [Pseudoalteromonas sp. THAF3]QFU06854.1 Vitamin B12 transporter BtuB precursor [Pseudoalteromonas sp. THAF3]
MLRPTFLSLLAFTQVALAQDDLAEIERITTTASRLAVSEDAMALNIATINAEQLAILGSTHIEKAMKQIAGANLQHGNGQEYLPSLRSPVFTGGGACAEVLALEDGIALRAAGFCNVNELFEAHSEMAERIEVLKGPGSALYGSNAVHGVINVITPDTTYGGGFAGLDVGSYGYKRAKLRAGKDLGEQGFGINSSVTRDSGYRDDESVEQEKINLRYRYSGDTLRVQTGLTYTHLDQQTAGYIEGFEAYKNEQVAQQNPNPEAFRKNRATRLWSQFTWQANGQSTWMITPYVRDQQMTFLKHFLPGKPLEENSQQGVGVQTLWQTQLNNSWQLNLGIDGEYTQGDVLQYQHQPTTGSAFLQATVPQGKHYDYSVDATWYAPFAQLSYRHSAWLVTLGARYEHIDYNYDNHMLAGRTRDDGSECGFGGCRYSRPASGDNSFADLSPKLSLSYQLSPELIAYTNLAKGYRAPQTSELYQLQRQQQVADLKSETINSVELGVKGAYNSVRFNLAGYVMHKDNFIFRDSDFFNVSDGESKHRGIELELRYQASSRVMLQLALSRALHTYEHQQVIADTHLKGNIMDTAPKWVANTQLHWQVSDDVDVALEWHHVSDYYTDPQNLHRYSGHDLINIRGAWQVNKDWRVIARVENVADTAYAERADFTTFSGDRYFPGRPRSVLFSIERQW